MRLEIWDLQNLSECGIITSIYFIGGILLEEVIKHQEIRKALLSFKRYGYIAKSGMYYSQKMKKDIPFANTLELIYLLHLENREDVVEYHYESIDIQFMYKNKEYVWSPDFDILLRDGQKLIVESKIRKPKRGLKKAKIEAAKHYACENGYKFKLITNIHAKKQLKKIQEEHVFEL